MWPNFLVKAAKHWLFREAGAARLILLYQQFVSTEEHVFGE
jgi:hypothetical protein